MSDTLLRPGSQPPVAVRAHTGWETLRYVAVHPFGLLALFLSICVGSWLGGAVGLIIGLLATLGLAAWMVHSPFVRRRAERHLVAREKRRHQLKREKELEGAGPLRRAEFAELYGLVTEIEGSDPGQSRRFELQELLDHYIRLAVGLQQLGEALQRSDRAPLWQAGTTRAAAEEAGSPSRQRQEILARRLEHRDQCRKQAARIAEELDAMAEFIHLVSEMTSCPPLDQDGERELERRLWELEAHESALRQLSAA